MMVEMVNGVLVYREGCEACSGQVRKLSEKIEQLQAKLEQAEAQAAAHLDALQKVRDYCRQREHIVYCDMLADILDDYLKDTTTTACDAKGGGEL